MSILKENFKEFAKEEEGRVKVKDSVVYWTWRKLP